MITDQADVLLKVAACRVNQAANACAEEMIVCPSGNETSSCSKNIFAKHFNSIPYVPSLHETFRFLFFRKYASLSLSRLIEEGRARGRHETRGGDAVGGAMSQRDLDRADERLVAHGQVVWSWRPGAGAERSARALS
jgi:hypothetical protein